jgi:hypothetical protein
LGFECGFLPHKRRQFICIVITDFRLRKTHST